MSRVYVVCVVCGSTSANSEYKRCHSVAASMSKAPQMSPTGGASRVAQNTSSTGRARAKAALESDWNARTCSGSGGGGGSGGSGVGGSSGYSGAVAEVAAVAAVVSVVAVVAVVAVAAVAAVTAVGA